MQRSGHYPGDHQLPVGGGRTRTIFHSFGNARKPEEQKVDAGIERHSSIRAGCCSMSQLFFLRTDMSQRLLCYLLHATVVRNYVAVRKYVAEIERFE